MSRLNGKVAIVTGGSRGIGTAIARQLAADGASVVVNYAKSAGASDDARWITGQYIDVNGGLHV